MVRSDMFSNHLINNKNKKYNSLLFDDILSIYTQEMKIELLKNEEYRWDVM